jgi:hypothetical protein
MTMVACAICRAEADLFYTDIDTLSSIGLQEMTICIPCKNRISIICQELYEKRLVDKKYGLTYKFSLSKFIKFPKTDCHNKCGKKATWRVIDYTFNEKRDMCTECVLSMKRC